MMTWHFYRDYVKSTKYFCHYYDDKNYYMLRDNLKCILRYDNKFPLFTKYTRYARLDKVCSAAVFCVIFEVRLQLCTDFVKFRL